VNDRDDSIERAATLRELMAAYPAAQTEDVVQALSQDDFDRQGAKARGARGGAIGIVVTPGGELVLVRRTGLYRGWALPGGTVEHGEAFDAAFRREIEEEIGVEVTSVSLLLAETKQLISPTGEQARFLLAVFGAHIRDHQLPPPTADAVREGLEAALFHPNRLPDSMILGDRQKLDRYARP
jgi:ADP-ribose pyrophosphatase YjhB (NUDIX family)